MIRNIRENSNQPTNRTRMLSTIRETEDENLLNSIKKGSKLLEFLEQNTRLTNASMKKSVKELDTYGIKSLSQTCKFPTFTKVEEEDSQSE